MGGQVAEEGFLGELRRRKDIRVGNRDEPATKEGRKEHRVLPDQCSRRITVLIEVATDIVENAEQTLFILEPDFVRLQPRIGIGVLV